MAFFGPFHFQPKLKDRALAQDMFCFRTLSGEMGFVAQYMVILGSTDSHVKPIRAGVGSRVCKLRCRLLRQTCSKRIGLSQLGSSLPVAQVKAQ